MYYSGARVGIGTTAPRTKLEIVQSAFGANEGLQIAKTLSEWWDFSIGADGGNTFYISNYNVSGPVMSMNNSGNVGIGTTAPDGQLHIFESATTHGINAAADNLIIEGTGVIGMTFASDADMSIAFSDNDANLNGRIMYDISEGDLTFWTNELQRVTFDDGGKVGIGQTSPGGVLHVEGKGEIQGIFENPSTSN